MPLPDDSLDSPITPPARSLDLERPSRPYLHKPESSRPSVKQQRRVNGGPQSPIYPGSSSSSLPLQERHGPSIDGRTGSFAVAGPRNSIDLTSRKIRQNSFPVRGDSNISLATSSSAGSLSGTVPSERAFSDIDISIVRQREEDDFDEDNEILEFKLNDADTGIIRNRASTEDGVPELVRYSTKNKSGSTSALNESTSVSKETITEHDDENSPFAEESKFTQSYPQSRNSPSPNGDSIPHRKQHQKDEMFSQNLDPHQTHTRNPSLPSEFSHQSALQSEFSHLSNNEGSLNEPDGASNEIGSGDEDDGGWQDMKTVGSYDIYDDKGRVIVHKKVDIEHEKDPEDGSSREQLGHASAAKGYTRVAMDDDAKSVNSMDENTDFLFGEDELERNPLSQLQATKDMLTDSQKIAYVGLCRLVMNNLAVELARLRGSRTIARALSNSQGSMAMWGQKMMIRLYAHMDIRPEGK